MGVYEVRFALLYMTFAVTGRLQYSRLSYLSNYGAIYTAASAGLALGSTLIGGGRCINYCCLDQTGIRSFTSDEQERQYLLS